MFIVWGGVNVAVTILVVAALGIVLGLSFLDCLLVYAIAGAVGALTLVAGVLHGQHTGAPVMVNSRIAFGRNSRGRNLPRSLREHLRQLAAQAPDPDCSVVRDRRGRLLRHPSGALLRERAVPVMASDWASGTLALLGGAVGLAVSWPFAETPICQSPLMSNHVGGADLSCWAAVAIAICYPWRMALRKQPVHVLGVIVLAGARGGRPTRTKPVSRPEERYRRWSSVSWHRSSSWRRSRR
jgi:hypothetical protein